MVSGTWLAVGLTAVAALLFAVATNLNRSAAALVPLTDGGAFRLLLRLLRTPRWLLGGGLALVALALHALALRHGGVILVQTVLSTGLVFALLLEAVREHRRLRPAEAAGAVLVIGGVVALVGLGRPGGGEPVSVPVQLLAMVLAVLVGAAGLLVPRTRAPARLVAVVMGGAAGACFAIDAVFLKGLATVPWRDEPARTALDLAGFLLASVLGNLVVQRAYQRAPLRDVLPSVTAGDPAAALVVGLALLQESLPPGPAAAAGVGLGMAAIVVGIVLGTSGAGDPPAPA